VESAAAAQVVDASLGHYPVGGGTCFCQIPNILPPRSRLVSKLCQNKNSNSPLLSVVFFRGSWWHC
jgi:hypothetical protein